MNDSNSPLIFAKTGWRSCSSLRPIVYDELTEAVDLIANFETYWDACAKVEEPEVTRQQLISKIVERVFVHEDKAIALASYGDFSVILGENETASYLAAEAISENLLTYCEQAAYRSHCGSDGRGSLAGCVVWVPRNGIYHLILKQILHMQAA